MRILYLGLPLGALCLAERGHRPIVVALGHPGAPGARRVRRRLGGSGTLVIGRPDLDDARVLRLLRAARPDVLLSWFWPTKIPATVLDLPRGGAFGVHPSLLPRWRGPDPYFWTLAAGDTRAGVSLHRLEAAYDTGPVVERRSVSIADTDNAWTLARRLDRPALSLLAAAADRLAAGELLNGTPQDANAATHAPTPTPEDLAIDFRLTVDEILRLVRAAAPEPGATADFAGHDIDVLAGERYDAPLPAALSVTEARRVRRGIAVRVGDGAILVTVARAGGTRLEGDALHRLFETQTS